MILGYGDDGARADFFSMTRNRSFWQILRKPSSSLVLTRSCPFRIGLFCLPPEEARFWMRRPEGLLARYLRAARERGHRWAVFWIFSGLDSQSQSRALSELVSALQRRGVEVEIADKPALRVEGKFILWLRRSLVFLIALAGPFAGGFFGPGRGHRVFFLTVMTGAISWVLLQSDIFRFQLEGLHFIGAVFVLPFVIHMALERLRGAPFFVEQCLVLVLVFFLLARLRMLAPVSLFEHSWRDWMEVTLGLRPRFSEAMGWFFFILARENPRWLSLSLLGPVVTLNSFLHAQASVGLVVIRSCAGYLIGAISAKMVKFLSK